VPGFFFRKSQALHSLRLSFKEDAVVCTLWFARMTYLAYLFLVSKGGYGIRGWREQSWGAARNSIPGVVHEPKKSMYRPLW